MADKVVWQGGDDLDEQNLTEADAIGNLTDLVVRGLGLTVDFGTNTLDTGSGYLVIETANNEAYKVFPDARTGQSLTDSAINHVYFEIDETTDDSITLTVNTTGTDPTNPSLKVGLVDTTNDTTREINRGQSVRKRQLTIDDTDSTYTTNGENVLHVDTSSGAVTVEVASVDIAAGYTLEVFDSGNNAGTNNITIQTQGSETINPGGASSISLTTDGTFAELSSDGSDLFADVNGEFDVVDTDSATVGEGKTGVVSNIALTTGSIKGGDVSLNDDEEVVLRSAGGSAIPALFLIRVSGTSGAVFSAVGDSISILDSEGSWTASDTDGNHCVFVNGSNDHVLKNRVGSQTDYILNGIAI